MLANKNEPNLHFELSFETLPSDMLIYSKFLSKEVVTDDFISMLVMVDVER